MYINKFDHITSHHAGRSCFVSSGDSSCESRHRSWCGAQSWTSLEELGVYAKKKSSTEPRFYHVGKKAVIMILSGTRRKDQGNRQPVILKAIFRSKSIDGNQWRHWRALPGFTSMYNILHLVPDQSTSVVSVRSTGAYVSADNFPDCQGDTAARASLRAWGFHWSETLLMNNVRPRSTTVPMIARKDGIRLFIAYGVNVLLMRNILIKLEPVAEKGFPNRKS